MTTSPHNVSVGRSSPSNQHSLRLVIQHNLVASGKSRHSRYRLILYGDSHVHRDFDSLPALIAALATAGVSVDASTVLAPDPQESSIILSQSIELSDTQLSNLGLKLVDHPAFRPIVKLWHQTCQN